MRIDASGNIFMGKTAANIGNVGHEFRATGLAVHTVDGNDVMILNRLSSDGTMLVFSQAGSTEGSVSISGSTTSYNTSSDGRLKDITGEARGLEIINSLNPVKFTWKNSGKEDEGLIAQEVLKVVPNAVTGSEETKYMMDYSKLVTPLVKAIQEQQEQIEELKNEIETLKN